MSTTEQQVSRRWAIALPVALLLAVFGYQIWLAFHWQAVGLFSIDDALFDADPWSVRSSLANGWGRRSFVHPHLGNFFSIPIRVLDVVASRVVAGLSGQSFREQVALLIAPLMTLIATLSVFRIGLLTTNSVRSAAVLALLYATSFAVLIFGAMPESFAISNGMIALLFWYAVETAKTGSDGKPWAWVLLGFVITSLTVTNLAAFFVVLAVHGHVQGTMTFKKSVMRASTLSAIAAVLSLGSAQIVILLLGYGEQATQEGVNTYVQNFVSLAPADIARNVSNMGIGFVQSFVSFGQMVGELTYCADLPQCRSVYFSTVSATALRAMGAMVAFALLGIVVWNASQRQDTRLLALAGVGVLFCNIGLHAIFGTEMFLYSMHWITPLVLLFTGLVHRAPWLFGAAAVIQLVVNLRALAEIPGLTILF